VLAHKHELDELFNRLEDLVTLLHDRRSLVFLVDGLLVVVAGETQLKRPRAPFLGRQVDDEGLGDAFDLKLGPLGHGQNLARNPFKVQHAEASKLALRVYGTEDRQRVVLLQMKEPAKPTKQASSKPTVLEPLSLLPAIAQRELGDLAKPHQTSDSIAARY
jgi:hypothetical protein